MNTCLSPTDRHCPWRFVPERMGFSQEGQGASREEWHGLCNSAGLEQGLVAPVRVWVIEPGGVGVAGACHQTGHG